MFTLRVYKHTYNLLLCLQQIQILSNPIEVSYPALLESNPKDESAYNFLKVKNKVFFNVRFHFKYFIKKFYFKQKSGMHPVLFLLTFEFVIDWGRISERQGVLKESHVEVIFSLYIQLLPLQSNNYAKLFGSPLCSLYSSFATFFIKCNQWLKKH